MRPYHAVPRYSAKGSSSLRAVASASFTPRGTGYDPAPLLRRRFLALRGGERSLVLRFSTRAEVIQVDLLAAGACSSEETERAFEAARNFAAIDDDPTDFYAMVREHPLLGKLARVVDPRLGRTPTVFEAFAVAVIEQLVTGIEARASIGRLWWTFGDAVPGTKLRAAPTAAAVRRVPMWRMHAFGIGSRRAAALREGAIRGDALERLSGESPADAVEKLQSLPGVGPWTANHVARHALGWSDAVPVGDVHAPYVVTGALTGEQGGDDEMLAALEPYRPHRARVVVLLERAHIVAGVPGVGRWRPPRVDPHRREPWKY